MKPGLALALLVIGCWAAPLKLQAATPRDLVGTWKLVSASASSVDGRVDEAPYGASPTGTVTYTANGRVSLMLSYGDRAPLSGSDRIASPVEERAEAFATFFAYAGRYSVSGGTVTHHVEISSVPNWVNTDLVRIVSVVGNRLTLRTPPLSVGGDIRTSELVWERVE